MIVLYTPESYRVATQAERNKVCNGCGAKGLGGWFVPNTLWGLSVKPACDRHDWMWEEGKTIADKEKADRVFLNNMVRIIENADHFGAGILRPLRRQRAMKYYSAVKDFGGPAFWKNKNSAKELAFA